MAFDEGRKILSWGNPGRPEDSSVLPITKFLIQAEIRALYSIPMLIQLWPMDETYTPPDPFYTIEGALLPPIGFQNLTGASKISTINCCFYC